MTKTPELNSNEFKAAELALRKIGSNLWFSSLSDEWQDFLVSNTLEIFDTYELSMHEAAKNFLIVYQELATKNPEILDQNPWEAVATNEDK